MSNDLQPILAELAILRQEVELLARMVQGVSPHGVVLRDAEGRLRAQLALEPNGSPFLKLLDSELRPRLVMFIGEDDQPVLGLHNIAGKPVLGLTVTGDGSAVLRMAGMTQMAVELVGGAGKTGLSLFDTEGQSRVVLGLTTDGRPKLELRDQH